jgi:hypothetical protein
VSDITGGCHLEDGQVPGLILRKIPFCELKGSENFIRRQKMENRNAEDAAVSMQLPPSLHSGNRSSTRTVLPHKRVP